MPHRVLYSLLKFLKLIFRRVIISILKEILEYKNVTADPNINALYACACQVASVVSTLCNPMDCSPPAPLSMGFSRQEYWSELPFPSPGDLSDPGIEL